MLINFDPLQGFRPFFLMSGPFTAIPSIFFKVPWLVPLFPCDDSDFLHFGGYNICEEIEEVF